MFRLLSGKNHRKLTVYHRKEQRIKSHILLCWLAMLMIRVAEQESHLTWFQMKKIFNKLHLGTLKTPQGTVRQTSDITGDMKKLFKALQIDAPNKVMQIET